MRIFLLILLLINLLGACVTFFDKHRAKSGGWRVRERTLFLYCFLGGCPGVYLMMRFIHHKTLHRRFMWGIPVIFVLQLTLISMIHYFNLLEGLQ